MDILNRTLKATRIAAVLALALMVGCKNDETKINLKQDAPTLGSENFEEVIWHVKAFHPDGKLLDVKAVDKDGHTYDVKSIQNSDQTSIMDVKAFVNGKKLPIKMLVSEDKFLPVKAIADDGTIINIKAITPEGEKLDVKGVRQSGNVIHIRAIAEDGTTYNVEAISPKGWINDVIGIKLLSTPIELTINGVDVYAHVKSIPQTNQM
jgi:hypothetical protein